MRPRTRVALALATAVLVLGSSIYIHHARRAAATGECAAGIAYGDLIACSITSAGQTHTYPFTGTSGDRLYVRMVDRGNTSFSPKFSIYRPNGTLLCTANSNNAAEKECVLDATGTHTIVAQDTNTATGSYTLYMQNTGAPAGTTALGYGTNVAGSLATGGVDDFTFTGAVGTIYLRMADPSNASLSPYIRLYRPNGTMICQNTSPDAAVVTCALDASGTYTVIATDSTGHGAGSYVLYLQDTANPTNATSIAYGDNAPSTIPAGQVRTYTFSGTSGDRIVFRMAEAVWGALTPNVKIFNPSGTFLCGGQASRSSENFCTLGATGMYTALIMDYYGNGNGPYGLYLQRLNGSFGTAAIAYSAITSGTLSAGGVEDFAFSGTAAEQIYFRAAQTSTSSFDPKIEVYRPDGVQLCTNFGNSSVEKVCQLSVTGTYTVLLMDNNGSLNGTYTMYTQRVNNPVNAVSVLYNQGYSSTLSLGGVHQFALGGVAGDNATFSMQKISGTLRPKFNVYRPDGTLLCGASNNTLATVTCTANVTGSYTILAMDIVGVNSGAYVLSATWNLTVPPSVYDPLNPTSNPAYPIGKTKDPVNTLTGDFDHQHTDLAIPGKGVPLEFTRYYHSGSPALRSLGHNWSHSYDAYLLIALGAATVFYPDGHASTFVLSNGVYVARPGVYDTFAQNLDGTYTLTTHDQVSYDFTAAGQLASIADRNGNTTELSYDGNGYLSRVTDAVGRSLTFTNDDAGRITQVTDPLNRSVSFQYDGNGDLAQVTDVKGGTTTYTYGSHKMASLTDANGHVAVQNTFDTAGRVVEQRDAVSALTCIYYGRAPSYTSTSCPGVSPAPTSTQTIVVDPRGGKTMYTFDAANETSQVKDPLGGTVTYSYDGNHNSTCVTDQLNHRTASSYDARGNLIQLIDAANTDANCALITNGRKWTYTYDQFNNVLSKTDPLGNTTTSVYDASGNLVSVTNALNQTMTFVVNPDGTVASATNPFNATTSFDYDAYGNQITVDDPMSHETTATYDLGGRKLTTTDPLNHTTTYTYDAQNNLLTVTDPLANATTYTYDAKGLKTSVTDANNDATSFDYDAADRLTTTTGALNETTTSSYDGNGNRTSLTNPNGKTTTYAYDLNNRLTGETDALSRATSYGYDAAGRRTSRTDAMSQVTGYSYDALDRLTFINYPAGTADVTFTYDAMGNRLTMVDGTGTTTFVYDALYRPTSITDGAGNVVGYGYDAAGRRTSITYPGSTGTVDYAYDPDNRLVYVTDWLSNTTSYTYDDADRLTSTTLGNGLITDRTYDDANRLLTLVNRDGGTTISSYTYTLDDVGNRTQMVDTSGTATYGYDDLYRLTGATYPNSDVQSYSYDEQGNRLTKVDNGNTTNYAYDDADQMTLAGGVSHSYDNNGNQTAAGSDTFAWDAENRLTSTDIGGVASTYVYNGAGLRASRTIGVNATAYAWDLSSGMPQVLQDSDGNKYVYGLDLISQTDGSTNQTYFLTDGLGSTTGLTDGSGTVVGEYTYDVFGAVRTQTGTTTERSYTGEQNDPTGLEYLRARYYDAASGRFLSLDAMTLAQRYAYSGGDPVNAVDPGGMCDSLHWLSCARDFNRMANSASDSAGNAVGAGLERSIAWAVDNYCQFGAPGSCLILRALDTITTKMACALDKEGYFDFNVTPVFGVGPTLGIQGSCREGLHPYVGLALSTPNVSFNVAPKQSIANGAQCAGGFTIPFRGSGYGTSLQFGRGGLLDFSTGNAGSGTGFEEVGIGTSGGGINCSYVFPRP